MTHGGSTIERAEIAADLERARTEFHRLLGEVESSDAWTKPTRGTRWTNEQCCSTWCSATWSCNGCSSW